MNLSGPNLSGAYFQGPDRDWPDEVAPTFADADLRGANMRGIYTFRTNFMRAALEGADLHGSRYDSETIWPVGINHEEVGAIEVD